MMHFGIRKTNAAYKRLLTKIIDKLSDTDPLEKDDVIKLVWLGSQDVREEHLASEYYEGCFEKAHLILTWVGLLTFNDLKTHFPITKTYDGERWATKDYAYSLQAIEEMKEKYNLTDNSLIGDADRVFELLWDYQNIHMNWLLLRVMNVMSHKREQDGHISMIEEFFAAGGMNTPNTFNNNKGEKLYVRNGRTVKVESVPKIRRIK